jgi:hypothetical protein
MHTAPAATSGRPCAAPSAQEFGGDPGRAGEALAQPSGRVVGRRTGRGEVRRARRPEREAMPGLDELRDIRPRETVPPFRRGAPAAGDEAAKLAVAAPVGGEQHQRQAAIEAELRADDQPRRPALERRMRAHHARHRAFVGDGERRVAERDGALREFLRLRGAAQEGEAAEAMQLRVSGRRRQIRGWSPHMYIHTVSKAAPGSAGKR